MGPTRTQQIGCPDQRDRRSRGANFFLWLLVSRHPDAPQHNPLFRDKPRQECCFFLVGVPGGGRCQWETPCGASPAASPQPPGTTSPTSCKAITAGDPQAASPLLPPVHDERRLLAADRLAHPTPGRPLHPTAPFLIWGLPQRRPCLRSRHPGPAPALLRRLLVEIARRQARQKKTFVTGFVPKKRIVLGEAWMT